MYTITWGRKRKDCKVKTVATKQELYELLVKRDRKEQCSWVTLDGTSFGEEIAGTSGDDSGVYTWFGTNGDLSREEYERVAYPILFNADGTRKVRS